MIKPLHHYTVTLGGILVAIAIGDARNNGDCVNGDDNASNIDAASKRKLSIDAAGGDD